MIEDLFQSGLKSVLLGEHVHGRAWPYFWKVMPYGALIAEKTWSTELNRFASCFDIIHVHTITSLPDLVVHIVFLFRGGESALPVRFGIMF